jgi:hypothetical protein
VASYVLVSGGPLLVLFGSFVETTADTNQAAVLFDNVLVCGAF